MPLESALGGGSFCERRSWTDHVSSMSQYGTQADPSKVWGSGGVTPLLSPPSSAVQKPLGSPYNGLGPYRSVNGNGAVNQNPNHLQNHWSSGIRLPTAPGGAPGGTHAHPQWDPSQFRSGVAATTANSGAYLTSPTSLGPGGHQGWYASVIPQNKLPHRPQAAFPSPTMQDEHQAQQQHASRAYQVPFSSSATGDMALLAVGVNNNSQHNSVNVSSLVPASHSQVYLPNPQSAPSAMTSQSLGEFLPLPRINPTAGYSQSLELDMLRSLQNQQQQAHSMSAPQNQVSPVTHQGRQFYSPPAQRLPSMSGAFSPLNSSARQHEIKSEIPFSPPHVSVGLTNSNQAAHSTTATEGLLAVRKQLVEDHRSSAFMTSSNQMDKNVGDGSGSRKTTNGLSSPRVSNSAQEVTTTSTQHSAPEVRNASPQYQQISPAATNELEESSDQRNEAVAQSTSVLEEKEKVSAIVDALTSTAAAQVSQETQESSGPPSCLPGEAVPQSSSTPKQSTKAEAPASDPQCSSLDSSISGNQLAITSTTSSCDTETTDNSSTTNVKAQGSEGKATEEKKTVAPSGYEDEKPGAMDSNHLDSTGADISTQESPSEGADEGGRQALTHGDGVILKQEVSELPQESADHSSSTNQSAKSLKQETADERAENTESHLSSAVEDDEDIENALVVDTEMHEPITPEEISPDPDASNQSSSSMSNLGINLAAESNRRPALFLEQQRMQSEGSIPGFLAGFNSSVTSVTRPPGLRPPTGFPMVSPSQPLNANSPMRMNPATTSAGQNTYSCPICGFTSTSKFHFNSHMNTHTDHQCSMCDYTARTEGRLKRHMKEFHSAAEQIAAGVAPSGELLDPQVSSSQSATPSALEQMQQALARSQEAFAQHSNQSTGSGSDAGTPPKDGERKQSTSSKPKHYRCKQCTHLSSSKEESWQHARSHIKPDKLLTCPQCEFVTEYKHHLEYHLRNHFGSKPFRCNKCNYSCVNKSMLNSHMKSHSSYYQFRCRDCTYATKYCHSLKLHLRKYGHHPQNIDLPDGTTLDINSPELDMFGRRGPKPKKPDSSSPSPFASPLSVSSASMPAAFPTSEPSPVMANRAAVMGGMSGGFPPNLLEALRFQQISGAAAMAKSIVTLGAQLPTIQGDQGVPTTTAEARRGLGSDNQSRNCITCGYNSTSQQDYVQHLFMHKLESVNFYNNATTAAAAQAILNQNNANRNALMREERDSEERSPSVHGRISPSHEGSQGSSGSPISGSKGSGDEGSNGTPGEIPTGGSSRRKGKAYKLDRIALRLQGRMSPSPESSGGHEEAEVMDVQAQDTEESINQNEVGMDTVESVVSSVIQSQPQSLKPKYSSAEEVRSQPSLQAAYEALKQVVEKQSDGSDQKSDSDESGGPDWASAFVCCHCQIAFKNEVMYHIHMGYHGYDNPFRCNRCGQLCQDSLGMFMHIAQAKH